MKYLNIRVALREVEGNEEEALPVVLRYIKRELKGWDGRGLFVDVGDRCSIQGWEPFEKIGEAWITEEAANGQA